MRDLLCLIPNPVKSGHVILMRRLQIVQLSQLYCWPPSPSKTQNKKQIEILIKLWIFGEDVQLRVECHGFCTATDQFRFRMSGVLCCAGLADKLDHLPPGFPQRRLGWLSAPQLPFGKSWPILHLFLQEASTIPEKDGPSNQLQRHADLDSNLFRNISRLHILCSTTLTAQNHPKPTSHLTKKLLGESATPPSDSFAWWIRWIFSTTEDLSGSSRSERLECGKMGDIWWHSRDMLRHVDESWWDQNFPIFNIFHCTTLFTPSIFTLQFTPFHSVSLWLRLQRFAITEAYDLPTNSKSSTIRDPLIHSRNPVNSNCDWLHLTPSNSVPFCTIPYHSGPHFTSLLKPEAVTGTAERWVPSGSNKRGKDMRRKGVALPVAPGETNWFHRDLGTFNFFLILQSSKNDNSNSRYQRSKLAQRNAATCTTLLGAIAETFFLCFTPLFLLVTLRWVWQKLHVTLFVSCQTNILMHIIYILYDMILDDLIWCIRIKTFTKHDKHLRSGCSRGLPRWVRRHEGQRLKKNSPKRWRGSSARSPESIWSDKGDRFKTAGTS